MSNITGFSSDEVSGALHLSLHGRWTVDCARLVERDAQAILAQSQGARAVVFDLADVEQLDTAGAWVIDRTRQSILATGAVAGFSRARPEHGLLLQEARYHQTGAGPQKRAGWAIVSLLADIGEGLVGTLGDFVKATTFLGQVMAAFARLLRHPGSFRPASIVYHVENFGLRSVPVVSLVTFLVGAIVAQQGLYQLRRFGASTYGVDLIGILVLRELAVLLTSIMIAGRSGSAITAEIGSMKMREEIDALQVMGLDPIEVLIVPRILALIIALPLLTFIADMAAIFGGLLVAWGYSGITPTAYLDRLAYAIDLETLLVGLIKAPFMAIVIGIIACMEGLAVRGSAESLGRQVTQSVVKAIFMVIAVDGFFAVFFVAIHY